MPFQYGLLAYHNSCISPLDLINAENFVSGHVLEVKTQDHKEPKDNNSKKAFFCQASGNGLNEKILFLCRKSSAFVQTVIKHWKNSHCMRSAGSADQKLLPLW